MPSSSVYINIYCFVLLLTQNKNKSCINGWEKMVGFGFEGLSFGSIMACFWLCSEKREKPNSDSVKNVQKKELLRSVSGDEFSSKTGSELGNRIMVVVDSSSEAEGALEWTLSHAVQSQDTIILVHVVKSSRIKGFESNNEVSYIKAYKLLFSMRSTCQKRRPGVQVEIALLEGKERGPIIVEEAKNHKLSLLVLAQRKRPILRSLLNKWPARSHRRRRKTKKTICGGTAEYCIENSSCLTVAVRRKSRRVGGYVITTKSHKNFWLLA